MISAQPDSVTQQALIEKYMFLPNQVCITIKNCQKGYVYKFYKNSFCIFKVWDEIISQASKNVDFLKDMAAVKQLGSILKTNVRACKALSYAYAVQLGRIYLDMLNVYKIMSENITQAISVNGVNITNQPLIKAMQVVKKETLTLISEYVRRSQDHKMIMENFIPPLLDAVLLDYQVKNIL